jgi:hypothetical protein
VLDDFGDDTVVAPFYEVAPDMAAATDPVVADLDTSAAGRADCGSSRQYLVYDHRFLSQIQSLHCSPACYSFPRPVYHLVRNPPLTDSSYMGLGRVELPRGRQRNLSLGAGGKLLAMNPMAKRPLDDHRVLMQNNPLYC